MKTSSMFVRAIGAPCTSAIWKLGRCVLAVLFGSILIAGTSLAVETGVLPAESLDIEHMFLMIEQPLTERTYYYIRVPLKNTAPHAMMSWKVPTMADATIAMDLLRNGQVKAIHIQTIEAGISEKCQKPRTVVPGRKDKTLEELDCILEPYSGKAPRVPCEVCNVREVRF